MRAGTASPARYRSSVANARGPKRGFDLRQFWHSLVERIWIVALCVLAGLFLGLTRTAAARFSFLLSVPAVVLSGLFELRKFVGHGVHGTGAGSLIIATAFAFVVGYASIAFLLRYLTRHSMLLFVVYRVVLGALVIALVAGGAIS